MWTNRIWKRIAYGFLAALGVFAVGIVLRQRANAPANCFSLLDGMSPSLTRSIGKFQRVDVYHLEMPFKAARKSFAADALRCGGVAKDDGFDRDVVVLDSGKVELYTSNIREVEGDENNFSMSGSEDGTCSVVVTTGERPSLLRRVLAKVGLQ